MPRVATLAAAVEEEVATGQDQVGIEGVERGLAGAAAGKHDALNAFQEVILCHGGT